MKNTSEFAMNGKTPHAETDPRDAVLHRLVQVENWVSSPSKRPGTDARSRLQSLFDAADDLNFAFASLPKGTFGVNESSVSRRILRLLDFCAATSADRTADPGYRSSLADLSDASDPDFISHNEMRAAESATEEQEALSKGRRNA